MEIKALRESINYLKKDEKYIKTLSKSINSLGPIRSKNVYEELYRLTLKYNLNYARAWVSYNYGWVYYDLGKIEESIRNQKKAYSIFEENNDTEGMASALNALVGCYRLQEKYDKAEEYSIRAVKFAEENGEDQIAYLIKLNMALTYCQVEEYKKAKEVLEQFIDLPNIITKENEIIVYLDLGVCEYEEGSVEKAFKYLNIAMEMAEEYDKSIIPVIYENMGNAYRKIEKYDLAHEMYSTSVKLSRESNHFIYLDGNLIAWAKLDLQLGNYEDALKKLIEVEARLIENNEERYKNKINELIISGYKGLGKYKEALDYSEKNNTCYKEKIKKFNKDKLKRIDLLKEETEYEAYKNLYNQSEVIYSIGKKIMSSLKAENIYQIVAEEVKNILPYDGIQIALIDDKFLNYVYCVELDEKVELKPVNLNEECLGIYAIKENRSILIKDIEKDYYKYCTGFEGYKEKLQEEKIDKDEIICKSMIFVPIEVNHKVIGMISVQSYEKSFFSMRDISVVRMLSTYVGIGLENAKLYKQIEFNAEYDELTRIYNRRIVLEKIEKSIEISSIDHSENHILMLDVDNFKSINDSYGHLIGDKVLKRVTEAISKNLNEDDLAGRYGGEEFIVLIKGNHIEEKAEAIRRDVEKLYINSDENKRINVTTSIGISKVKLGTAINKTIKEADKALYNAKETGKNKIVYF